ncbi:MAG: ABC transporter permease [Chloracidobacterium sp.]|nr:ABC transporter permease [Chloracidobacterium sp.]
MLDKEVKRGSTEMLILALLEDRPRQAYEIAKLTEKRSEGMPRFHPASLHPLLYRMEKRGLIKGAWIEKAGRRERRLRGALATTEIAIAIAMLAGAGLLIRSLWRLQQVDPGFNVERLLTMKVALPGAKYPEAEQPSQFFERMLGQVAALPGVKAAAVTTELPFTSRNSASSFQIVGRTPLPTGQTIDAGRRTVSADYFHTPGLRLLRGRYFDHRDNESAPRVVIINETMARKFWPGEDPLGRRITYNSSTQFEIIGVVSDVKHSRLQGETGPEAYTYHRQLPSRTMDLAARADASAGLDYSGLIAGIRQAVRSVDSEQPVYDVRTMEQRLIPFDRAATLHHAATQPLCDPGHGFGCAGDICRDVIFSDATQAGNRHPYVAGRAPRRCIGEGNRAWDAHRVDRRRRRAYFRVGADTIVEDLIVRC